MAQTLLATRQITKRYGSSVAVDGVSLTLQEGQIYGLVGQNGAGKTTLMRMMTGQTLPSSGELELFGETSPQGIDRMRANLGAVVETPSFFPFFTARENLEYYRRQRGIVGRGCIDDALRQVELGDTGSKKFKDFSLGMKQRLGLALALLNRPAMLLLDEPINGLDPMGIAHFRTLIQKLCEENGVTVLISSHILSELESFATCYGFIHRGSSLNRFLKSCCASAAGSAWSSSWTARKRPPFPSNESLAAQIMRFYQAAKCGSTSISMRRQK